MSDWPKVHDQNVEEPDDGKCPLCGKDLGAEIGVHDACSDYEAARADLSP